MDCHGLRCVLDAAGGTETTVGSKRIVRRVVRSAATLGFCGAPGHDLVQKAHSALMGDVRNHPGSI